VVGSQTRTVKVLQGIALGACIVKPEWILNCIETKGWISEDVYEAVDWFPGGKVARIAKANKEPKLFSGIKFYVGPNTDMQKEKLESIIRYGGGKVDQTMSAVTDYCISGKRRSRKVITKVTLKDKPITTITNAKVVDEKWVFDALEVGKLPNPKEYSIDYNKLVEEGKKKNQ